MKKQYKKPGLQEYQVINTPLMEASYGEGSAEQGSTVLGKSYGDFDFTDLEEEYGIKGLNDYLNI